MANDKTNALAPFTTSGNISKAEAGIGKRTAKLAAEHNAFSHALGALLPDVKPFVAEKTVRRSVAMVSQSKADVVKMLRDDSGDKRLLARRTIATLPGAFGVRAVLSVLSDAEIAKMANED